MHTLYIASLRNSTEFAFMKRFFMRMHVLHFLRNSTEFREYSLWEWMFLWHVLISSGDFDLMHALYLSLTLARCMEILDGNFFCDRVNLQVINLDQQMFRVFLSSCHDSSFLSLRRFARDRKCFCITNWLRLPRLPGVQEFGYSLLEWMFMHCIFTEFYGICVYEEILYENACFTFFYGILRNFKNILCGSGCFFWCALISWGDFDLMHALHLSLTLARFWMTTSFVTE